MKEQINFVISDLNDIDKTLEQLCKLFEKIIYYYTEKDVQKLVRLIDGCLAYFYLLHSYIKEAKEGEENEN